MGAFFRFYNHITNIVGKRPHCITASRFLRPQITRYSGDFCVTAETEVTMPHRTLNPRTAFYGDMREHPHRRRISQKQALASDVWDVAYPGERMPYRARDVYADLQAAGFVWNGAAWHRACAPAGDGETKTRAAGEHDG